MKVAVSQAPKSLLQAIERWAQETPDALAMTGLGHAPTYGKLAHSVTHAAQALRRLGVARGQRVSVLGRNHPSHMVVFLACAKIGAVMVPLNWRLSEAELSALMSDIAASLLLTSAEFSTVAGVLAAEHDVAAVSGGGQDLEAALIDAPAVARGPRATAESSNGTLLMCYTSGTTGRPKGVQLSEANFLAAADQMLHWAPARWRKGSVSLCALPLFHIAGLRAALFPLLFGGTAVFPADQSASAILEALSQHRVEKLSIVPTLLMALVRSPELAAHDLTSLETVFYGGAPMPVVLVAEARTKLKCDLVQIYGLSETTGCVTALSAADAAGGRPDSCGQALPGTTLEVRDGACSPVGNDVLGEVWVRGPTVAAGYWRRETETRDAFSDAWFRTGDLGQIDAGGYLCLSGRASDVIKTGGEKVAPAEVESIISNFPGVADVAVIGVQDDHWGEKIIAAIVTHAGHDFDAVACAAHCRIRLAGYKVPKEWVVRDTLPRNANGKLQRAELRRQLSSQ